jgi:hypothetical protein
VPTETSPAATFFVAEIQSAIEAVHEATGTRREFVHVTFEFGGGVWYWTVSAIVRTFATPTGQRISGRGAMQMSGIGSTPAVAALGCIADIERTVAGGREITSGGRIEVAR